MGLDLILRNTDLLKNSSFDKSQFQICGKTFQLMPLMPFFSHHTSERHSYKDQLLKYA